jgi:hypothetical protein
VGGVRGSCSAGPGQKEFLAGLDAFRQAGLLRDFEASKREFIGSHARTPVLLVQGPPGTGKSYSSAFAIFARLQGAMREGQRYRAFLSCKTHKAADVLLAGGSLLTTLLLRIDGIGGATNGITGRNCSLHPRALLTHATRLARLLASKRRISRSLEWDPAARPTRRGPCGSP